MRIKDNKRIEVETSQALAIEFFHCLVEGRHSTPHICFALSFTENHQTWDMRRKNSGNYFAHKQLLSRGTYLRVAFVVLSVQFTLRSTYHVSCFTPYSSRRKNSRTRSINGSFG